MKNIFQNIIKKETKEIDLALSGSGTRLLGHIGGILALQDLNYKAVRVAATSGGAIIAALYCAGMNMKKVKELFLDFDLKNMRSFNIWMYPWHGGIYSNKRLIPILDRYLKGMKMKDLKIPLTICTHDIVKNISLLITKKNFPNMKVSQAATISSSIPIYFGYHSIKDPKTSKELKLVDGGISKNYPVDVLNNQGRETIGLWIRGDNFKKESYEFTQIGYIKNTLTGYAESLAREHIEDADWAKTIPIIIEGIRATDFRLTKYQKEKMIQTGYDAVINWYTSKKEI